MFTTRVQRGFSGLSVGLSALAMGGLNPGGCPLSSGANPSIPTAIFAPSPTASALITPTETGTATMTNTFTATLNPATLFNERLNGSSGVTHRAYYPGSFFTAGFNGDILYRTAGDGTITPISDSQPIQVSVVGSSDSRPQIQFRVNATPNDVVFTAPQNTANNILLTSFVPGTATPLRFSIIDTGTGANFHDYVVRITQ